jgi:flavorubredoxin
MAEAICKGATEAGAECVVIDAKEFSGISDLCAIAIGSSTRMKKVLPKVKQILAELTDLKGLPAAGFGSYGWSGEAPDDITSRLTELNAEIVIDEPIKAKDYPGESVLEECQELGALLAERC